MARVQLPLDRLESSVTGIYMENLISCWFDQGLTPEHSKVLGSLLNPCTNYKDLFVKCLEKEERVFRTVRNQIMRSLAIWEEVPAWDEVWRLKLAFDQDRKTDWSCNVKLYTVIVCKILPEMIMKRNEHEDVWRTKRDVFDPIDLWGTLDWYQEKFKQYQARQAERERSRQTNQEAILRYKALTRGAYDPKASDFAQQLDLPLTEVDLKRLIVEPPGCPVEWWVNLREGGFVSYSHKDADPSPWQPPDFSSRQEKPVNASSSRRAPVFGNLSSVFGSTSPSPPDFTSSTSKASPSTRAPVFGNLSSVFGSTSPLPPDFTSLTSKASLSIRAPVFGNLLSVFGSTSPSPPNFVSSASNHNFAPTFEASGFASSASKAPSSAKAPLFTTREHESPFSAEQFKSKGNLGVTVSDSTESEAS
ncbi:hypothetical protein CEP53_003867 [Fusarium sp. AF-6]|nr:hypothetical protein CEP53_003867 [Fusarium sp. AF-6]